MEKEVAIRGDYITLGQLVKFTGLVSLGSQEKAFLTENVVLVNGAPESRRGRKVRPGDRVEVTGITLSIVAKDVPAKD